MTKDAKHDKLQSVLTREIARAEGADSDDLSTNRAQAMDYYWAKPRGDEKEGRSDAQSTDVADMVNADLALLVPMISTDAVAMFEANGEEDEAQAEAESAAVNKIIIEENAGFIEIQEACKDALLLKNGCLKVTVDDFTEVQSFPLPPGLPNEQIAALLEPRTEGDTREIKDNMLTVMRDRRRFVVNAVPIENISYQAGYCGRLQDIRFFAEEISYTRSELVEMGIDRKTVDELPTYSEGWNKETSRKRNATHTSTNDAETRDQDQVECHECYQLIDLNGDGVSERYRCLIANRQTLLDYEPADLLPYSLGSPFLNPHRITGESLFDHLKATQDVKTKLLRQYLDNVAVINNGRYAYDPDATYEEDVLTPKAGGGIRARNPAQSVVPIPVIDVTSGIQMALDYQDKMRTERGGAALEMLSSDKQLVGETAHGIERQMAMREQMVSMMGKNLAETLIRGIYELTHEFMRRYASEPVIVRRAGQAVPLDPRQWPMRKRCNVTTGMSPGQRGHIQSVLQQAVQVSFTAMQAGANGILADAQTIYRQLQAWMRTAGIDNPESLWIDPSSPKAQQAAQSQAQSQAAQAKQQTDLIKAQLRLEADKTASSDRQHHGDLRFKYDELNVKTEIEEAKLTVTSTVDLEKERMKINAQRRGEEIGGSASSARGGAT